MDRSVGVAFGALILSVAAGVPPLAAQEALPSDVMEVLEHRVGRWVGQNDVLGPDGAVVRTTQEAHEAATTINGEIVEIRGFIDGHEDFRAFLLFNPSIDEFVYTTIDRTNNHVVMKASREAPYRFTSGPIATPDGGSILFRLVFETVESSRLEGYGEASADGGTTWRRVFNQRMERVR